jgi:hypothetical protein
MARPRLLLPLASFIARSAALVTPVAEAAVPPVPFILITGISPVSWPAARARPVVLKGLTW